MEWYRKAATLGYPLAHEKLANFYCSKATAAETKDIEKDKAKAHCYKEILSLQTEKNSTSLKELIPHAVKSNDPLIMRQVSLRLKKCFVDSKKDLSQVKETRKLMFFAAKQGDPRARHTLGLWRREKELNISKNIVKQALYSTKLNIK